MASVVLDVRSGTFFSADDACLVDLDQLTDEQVDELVDGTDTERTMIGDTYGVSLDSIPLQIAALMSNNKWDADLMQQIADLLRDNGYTIGDTDA